MPTYNPPSIMFVRGDGSELWDRAGKRYIDWLAGIAVCSLGHSNPEVAAAIAEQASKLLHVSNVFATEHQAPISKMLSQMIGRPGQVFFSNSGAEANEAALKLARKWGGRGRHKVVCAYQSFHGRTLNTLAATGQPAKWEAFMPLPDGFKHAVWADIDDLERQLDDSVAAVLLEPVQGEGGVNPATTEYFAAVRRLCDERGLLFIADEVQAGLARTGKWFGFQHFFDEGAGPDVVTMAKALGNGMPIGACWATPEAAAAFKPGDHATTFGGQPMATSAARRTLELMLDMDAPAVASRAATRLIDAVVGIDGVSTTRGLGLLMAVELEPGIDAKEVATTCLRNGLVLNAVTATALRLTPPITISDALIDEGVEILARSIAEVRS
ncbi:MAG: aminotransferase class III-fold pyridoxal phosphate-dependent enzyme [Acidimicrobiales bacterium]|nr:aminotransferase class III-fold pyridoxal phosphate-dependent enzyme [Acidimicrobiales bacterium]